MRKFFVMTARSSANRRKLYPQLCIRLFEIEIFQQSALIKEMLLRNSISAFPPSIAEVGTKIAYVPTFRKYLVRNENIINKYPLILQD